MSEDSEEANAPPALSRLTSDQIWLLWRRVTRALPLWTMPWESLFAPSARTMLGVDYVSGLRRNGSTRKVFALLEGVGPRDLRRLHLIAQVNRARQEAVARWTAIGLVTLPVSGALALAQLAPGLLREIRAEWLDLSATTLAFVGAMVVVYLLAAWRARQIVSVIELAFVERDVALEGEAAGEWDPGLPGAG
ncbi:MAG TPA: hypothetical protein VF559_04875 [Caulobacteraceae bacterium]